MIRFPKDLRAEFLSDLWSEIKREGSILSARLRTKSLIIAFSSIVLLLQGLIFFNIAIEKILYYCFKGTSLENYFLFKLNSLVLSHFDSSHKWWEVILIMLGVCLAFSLITSIIVKLICTLYYRIRPCNYQINPEKCKGDLDTVNEMIKLCNNFRRNVLDINYISSVTPKLFGFLGGCIFAVLGLISVVLYFINRDTNITEEVADMIVGIFTTVLWFAIPVLIVSLVVGLSFYLLTYLSSFLSKCLCFYTRDRNKSFVSQLNKLKNELVKEQKCKEQERKEQLEQERKAEIKSDKEQFKKGVLALINNDFISAKSAFNLKHSAEIHDYKIAIDILDYLTSEKLNPSNKVDFFGKLESANFSNRELKEFGEKIKKDIMDEVVPIAVEQFEKAKKLFEEEKYIQALPHFKLAKKMCFGDAIALSAISEFFINKENSNFEKIHQELLNAQSTDTISEEVSDLCDTYIEVFTNWKKQTNSVAKSSEPIKYRPNCKFRAGAICTAQSNSVSIYHCNYVDSPAVCPTCRSKGGYELI